MSEAAPAAPDVRRAWLAVAAIPVAFVLAMLVGEGLLSLAGYPDTEVAAPPLGLALLIALPLTLLAMLPAVLAVRFGRRAHRGGHLSGRFAAAVGWLALAYWSLTFALSLVDRAIN
jgi:hypothetical protein